MAEQITIQTLLSKKQAGKKITMLTAYDYTFARLIDNAGVDVILVGDSLGMVMLGYKDTLPVTMEEMLHHTSAVSRGVQHALLVADLPFLSYQTSIEEGVRNAGCFLKKGGAQGVKLEGGREVLHLVQTLVAFGIPVMGHLGLTPQSYHQLGGYRVQGRSEQGARRIFEDAMRLEEAGIFALVLECVPWQLAKLVSDTLSIPVIGIGAGVNCDGQVLVMQDMLGLNLDSTPKHSKKYADLDKIVIDAFTQFITEVESGSFPASDQTFSMDEPLVNSIKGFSP